MTKEEILEDQEEVKEEQEEALEDILGEEEMEFHDILSEEEVQSNTLRFQQFLMGQDTNVALDQRNISPILNLEEDLEEEAPEEKQEDEKEFIDYNTLNTEQHPVYDLGEKKDPTSIGSMKYQESLTKEHKELYRSAQQMNELSQSKSQGEFYKPLSNFDKDKKKEMLNVAEKLGLSDMIKSYTPK